MKLILPVLCSLVIGLFAQSNRNIDQITALLMSKNIGSITLDHDDHIYKCLKIANEAQKVEGSLEALSLLKVKFDDTLDDDEVDLLIRLGKTDTKFFTVFAAEAAKIGKKITTVEEIFYLLEIMENGGSEALMKGITLASRCLYRLPNDFFSLSRINLFCDLGKIEDQNRFLELYNAMLKTGMKKNADEKILQFLRQISMLEGDVAGSIIKYLFEKKWKSRQQPGKREYNIIRDLMKNDYSVLADGDKSGKPAEEKPKIKPSGRITREGYQLIE